MTATTTTATTDRLALGDVVRTHGMRVRLDDLTTYTDRGTTVYAFAGTILNVDEVDADGFVPKAFRVRADAATHRPLTNPPIFDSWTVQGNDLATWTVELPVCAVCGPTDTCIARTTAQVAR